ncbi:hypothetical protein OAJ74_04295 [Alphaproteobacteria bacterium]|nr:hypothetical protein [Alphaproteobacteria bacterium]
MAKKNLFKKRKKINYKQSFILGSVIIVIVVFFYSYPKHPYFEIPELKDSYYIIPENKGGKKIINQDKKGLHLSNTLNYEIQLTIDPLLKFSIQIFSSDNYDVIKNKMHSLINSVETIFFPEDLYLAVLKHNFGNEFLLLYKNFNSRIDASNHCSKYVYFVENCIIVNVKNLE